MKTKEHKMKLASTPALLVCTTTLEKAAAKGCVLFYHGLRASKEINKKELLGIARRGYLAVGLDNVGHGERLYPDFDNRFKHPNTFLDFFLNMVKETAEEIPGIIDALIEKGLADPERICVSGISMGGYITYSAVLKDKRIKAALPILGSPRWRSSLPDSPHSHPDKFFPVALFSQNAGKDESVPPGFAREFHEHLVPYYRKAPERLCYREYPNSGHFMQEDEWNALWNNALDWLDRFLVQ
jgi:uncharacterized protein